MVSRSCVKRMGNFSELSERTNALVVSNITVRRAILCCKSQSSASCTNSAAACSFQRFRSTRLITFHDPATIARRPNHILGYATWSFAAAWLTKGRTIIADLAVELLSIPREVILSKLIKVEA